MSIKENALEAIQVAEQIAHNSDSNDQKLSLLSSFFDSAVSLIPDDQLGELVNAITESLADVISSPSEDQVEPINKLKQITEQINTTL